MSAQVAATVIGMARDDRSPHPVGELEDIRYGKVVDALALSGLWTAANDARGYALLMALATLFLVCSLGLGLLVSTLAR
mgnify:CR=1 FL=1